MMKYWNELKYWLAGKYIIGVFNVEWFNSTEIDEVKKVWVSM